MGQSVEGEPEKVGSGAHIGGGQSYGIDEPLTTVGLAAAGVLVVVGGLLGLRVRFELGSVLSFFVLLLGFVVGFVLLVFALSLYISSRSWKPRELERLSSVMPWGGDELVLDVGCGRGLFSNIVADEVPSGGVVALDLWKKRDLSGNDPKSVISNARARGTRPRIFLVRADPRFLPFANGVFDAAVSGLAINHISGAEGKASCLRDTVRVLKGGGRLALLVAGGGRDTFRVLEKEALRDLKVSSFRLGLFPPTHSVLARKSFARAK
ncbi:MAG: class I SAM-dependent methyltransferase [Nitrososphaerales archaeon]